MQLFIDISPVVIGIFFVITLGIILINFLRTKELSARFLRWGFFVSVFLFFTRGMVYSVAQYLVWRSGFLKFLSFYQSFVYVARYAFLHFFSSFFLSLFVAVLLLAVFWALQKYSHGRWLDTNERWLVCFGALAAGWPGAILYAGGVFLLPLIATPWLARNVTVCRVRLVPFIILSALIAMFVTPIVLPYAPWLAVLVCRTCL